MFPGRPVPQQQNPWELAPEVYVARGRNLGRDEGFQQGRNAGWNQAVRQANQVIEQQQQMIEDLQQQVQARVDSEKYNQQVALGRAYFFTIETLCRDNPGAMKAIQRAFKQHYLREMDESLKDGGLRRELHQDAQFVNASPRTSRFILDALAS
jgi:hypothetical protein